MELLILGIDAGDERIISAMDMPKLKGLLKGCGSYEVCEDLSSRGWAEMLSGKNGRETGAFYAKPKLDGTRDCTLNFDTHDYERNAAITPLWKLLNDSGKTVGFMNIPTTKYAPQVEGFFVSGAGGGLAGVDGIPKEFCFPIEIAEYLNEQQYIIDTRLLSSRIKDMDEWLDRLKATMKKRTDCYIGLQNRYQTDIGFIAYIATQRMQYLAMSEIEDIIANHGQAQNKLQEKIKDLFRYFDDLIGQLVDAVSPQNVMVVSDHGQSKYLYDINVNYFLKDIGYWNGNGADKAFGMFYVSGIFINDERFEGVVSKEKETRLIEEIIEKFNERPDAVRYSMKARRYRACYKDCAFEKLLPDIWIDAPETMFFLPWTDKFVSSNRAYGPVYGLRSVTNEMNTGIKARKGLMYAPFDFENISKNLTGVYEIIREYLKSR